MTSALHARIAQVRSRIVRRGVGHALRYAVLSRILRLMHLVPASPRSDRLYAYLDFVRKNGRRPSERMLLNDVVYRMKVDGELASPLRVQTTDKELVKRYIAHAVGERYAVPTTAVLRSEEEVRAFAFPERCAIKPTHATGRVILRQAGEPIDLDRVVSWLGYDQYRASREPNYRGLDRKVIVEPLLDSAYELTTFCYGGEVRFHATNLDRPMPLRGPGWIAHPYSISRAIDDEPPELTAPERLAELEAVVATLAGAFGLVRVDAYIGLPDGGFAIGELTHSHASGGQPFANMEQEERIGRLLFGTERPAPERDADLARIPTAERPYNVPRGALPLVERAAARATVGLVRLRQRIRDHGPLLSLWYMTGSALLRFVAKGPNAAWVDRAYATVHFVVNNRRLPSDRPLFNDLLYRYKVSGELAEPLRRRTADKAGVKAFVSERVGPGHTVPTLALLATEHEVRSYAFPDRCAIKPTHSTGRVILRQGGEPIDLDLVASWLRHDLYRSKREQHYRGLEPRIIVEPLVTGGVEHAVFCYHGAVRLHAINVKPYRLFGPGWIDLQDTMDSPKTREWRPPPKPLPAVPEPHNLDAIERLAEAVSTDFSMIRVDLYLVGDEILVGELTHCHASASHLFHSLEQEAAFHQWIVGGADPFGG